MNDSVYKPADSAACHVTRPGDTLRPFKPARTLLEAIDAAREAARAEAFDVLSDDFTPKRVEAAVADGSAFTDVGSVAGLELAGFLREGHHELAAQIAEEAIELRLKMLADRDRTEIVMESDKIQPLKRRWAIRRRRRSSQISSSTNSWRLSPMPSQPRVRFMVTCRCPSAFRLKLFRNERNSRCVRRGRNSAFQDLKSVLSWDAAVAMAELIAEAAWQFRARELASPPSAYKTISESNIEDINK